VAGQNATTLHLGVTELPYQSPPTTKTRGKKTGTGAQTTGDVAEILESRYHIMTLFFEEKQAAIIQALEDSVESALQSILMGAPATLDPYGSATATIETMFRQFISQKGLDGVVPGVPTAASLLGISKRFKNRRNPGRPSFYDTGLYSSAMRAWVD
jgi:hypothetical protein